MTDSSKLRNLETEQGSIKRKYIRHKQSAKIKKIGKGDLKSEADE